jgi:hypothetical protein
MRAPSSPSSASSDRAASPPSPLHAVPCVSAPRRSTRHSVAVDGSSVTDEDTMQKAMRHKAALNLDFNGMNSQSSSFVSLSTPVISSKLNVVGIRLGKNVNEINLSANVLRRMNMIV